jgi:uroporphyrinogen decarboxylase
MSAFLDVFQNKKTKSPPLWFMRQAGRYLPEYREIREKIPTFLDLCYNPELATEVTLQPIRRFDLDAAILFSDILVIPHALGQQVSFEKGEGPQLSPLSLSSFQEKLSPKGFQEKLSPIYEALDQIRSELPPSKALLGFAGAPWTLALYMLEGKGTRDFAKAKQEAFTNEKLFDMFLDFLVEAISLHLIQQVKAGATALQLFDSWAGLCPATHFQKWILDPTRKIVAHVKAAFPDLPLIGFPKGIGANLIEYDAYCDFPALSLDSSMPLSWAVKNLSPKTILQGNLDPLLLVAGGDPLKRAIISIHEQMGERPYIFNLGHGIVPQTPPKNVEDCVRWVRGG